jgi:hypothetical protein
MKHSVLPDCASWGSTLNQRRPQYVVSLGALGKASTWHYLPRSALAGKSRHEHTFSSSICSRLCRPSHYVRRVLPVLQRRAVIKLRARFGGEYEPGFDHFEQARCRACFGAFKFVDHVVRTGELLVKRMRAQGHFAALHLRFEPDMVSSG